jgi:hypothetical protein
MKFHQSVLAPHRIFVLSPANCGGERARLLLRERSSFLQAELIRSPEGLPLGDLFSFLSALYFRSKLAYAQTFAQPPPGAPGVHIITPTRGLRLPHEPVTLELLREFASVNIKENDVRYRSPFEKDARELSLLLGENAELVLLGSIATRKYLDVLGEIFRDRLWFPAEFVGRGDMSRGGLLLRCVQEGRELRYIPGSSAVWHGSRSAKLKPICP